MKANFNGEAWTISTSRAFTVDEVLELMKSKGNFGGIEIEMKKTLGIKLINLAGAGGYYNSIQVSKQITISQFKSSKLGVLKSLAIDAVTDGIGSLLNIEGGQNAPVLQAIAEEVERLVNENQ